MLIVLAQATGVIDRSLTAVVAPDLQRSFDLDDTGFGLIYGPAYSIIHSVGLLTVGLWVDRVDRFRLMACGVLGWTLASAICALAGSTSAFVLGRLMMGLAQAAFIPAAVAVILDLAPRGRSGLALSFFTAASATGRSAALMLGGGGLAAIAWFGAGAAGGLGLEDWRLLLLVSCIPSLILGTLLLRLRDPVRAIPPGRDGVWGWIRDHRAVLIPHGLAAACVVLLTHSITAWGPSLLHRIHDLPIALAATAAGMAILIGAPLGHLLGGWGVDRLASRGRSAIWQLAAALAASGAFGITLGFSPGVTLAMTAYLLMSASLAIAALTALAIVGRLSPPGRRGAASAIFFALTSLVGATVGPPLVGLISDAQTTGLNDLGFGIATVAAGAALLGIVASMISLAAARRERSFA